MSRSRTTVIAAGAAVLALTAATPAEARVSTCTPYARTDTSVIGGQTINTTVRGERCGRDLWVYSLESVSWDGGPYRISRADLYRFQLPGSRAAVRSAGIAVNTVPARAHRERIWRVIPARDRGTGWAGYMKVREEAHGETRVVIIHLG